MTPFVAIDRAGRVLEIELNRPDKRNALNREMCEAIVEACHSAEKDPAIGAIYWKAKGDVFCSGMDLTEANAEATSIHRELFTLGERLTKPIVCAVNGPALGGGLGLVANAHIAIAVHGSQFGLTEIRLGMWPYAIYRALENALGARRTLALSLSSKIFNTPEALAWGLIEEVVPQFELDDRGATIANILANASPDAIARGLGFAEEQRALDRDAAMDLALSARAKHFESPDFAEGLAAFQEKRKPRWPSLPATKE